MPLSEWLSNNGFILTVAFFNITNESVQSYFSVFTNSDNEVASPATP